MDWDKQFASIVTETEANLAKVKQRLESARAVTASLSAISASGQLGASNERAPQRTFSSQPGGATDQIRDELSRIPLTPRPTLASISNVAASSSTPGWVLLLEDKVSRQNKMIEELVQTVHELQAEKTEYWAQIKELREAIATLHERIIERGIDLHTEAKMEQWRKMTENDKNLLRDEYDHVKKELEHMKAKLITVEHTIAIVNEETLSFTKRQGALHENLTELADSARSNYKELATLLKEKTRDIYSQKEEIRDLKKKLFTLPESVAKQPLLAQHASTPASAKEGKKLNNSKQSAKKQRSSTAISTAVSDKDEHHSADDSLGGHVYRDRRIENLRRGPPPVRSEHSVSDSSLSLGYLAARKTSSLDDDFALDTTTTTSKESLSSLSLSDLE